MLTIKTFENEDIFVSAQTIVNLVDAPIAKTINMNIEGRDRQIEVNLTMRDLVMLDAVSSSRAFQQKHPHDPEYSKFVLVSTESEECGITEEEIVQHIATPKEYYVCSVRTTVSQGYPEGVLLLLQLTAEGEFKNVPQLYDQIVSDGLIYVNKILPEARKIVEAEAKKAAEEKAKAAPATPAPAATEAPVATAAPVAA